MTQDPKGGCWPGSYHIMLLLPEENKEGKWIYLFFPKLSLFLLLIWKNNISNSYQWYKQIPVLRMGMGKGPGGGMDSDY